MKSIAFLGTGSDVGKSLIAAAFCRIFSDKGYKTVPFKAQNMSNNSGVTMDGLEMGRAQIMQALAARCVPSVHMNPVLIKPVSNTGSQVIVQGKVFRNTNAYSYFSDTSKLEKKAWESFDILKDNNQICVLEGAGSCAEMNLKDRDFVNLKMAEYANSKVVIVGDIDKGGIFAQLIGTWELLSEKEKNLISGFIINKFRGDIRLFYDGVKIIEEKTGKKVIGVVPYSYDLRVEEEDGISQESRVDPKDFYDVNRINVGIIRLPRISNFTDFNSLEIDDRFNVGYFYRNKSELEKCDVLIIPGSKFSLGDLKWLKENGFEKIVFNMKKNGKIIVGICGGMQMLGRSIDDTDKIEGDIAFDKGFGLLDCETYYKKDKILKRIEMNPENISKITGYEIHMGITKFNTEYEYSINKDSNIIFVFDSKERVFGTYIHGIFDSIEFRDFFIEKTGFKHRVKDIKCEYDMDVEIDKLADIVRESCDVDYILKELELNF